MDKNKATKSLSFLAIILLIFIGLNMRTGLTIIPPILSNIQKNLNLPGWFLGSLTTIPLLCFALVSPFVDLWRQKIGLLRVLILGLILLTAGSFLRVYSFTSLLIGTLLLGAGIAVLNVLAPAVVATYFPTKIGLMTSVYSLAMSIFSALSAGFSAPLAGKIGWQPMVQFLAIFPAITCFITLGLTHQKPQQQTERSQTELEPIRNVWTIPSAWFLTGYMGIQSLLFYTILTWLPSIMMAHGISQNNASLLLGAFQLAGVPMAFIIPNIAGHRTKQSGLMLLTATAYVLGFIVLLSPELPIWLAICSCIFLGVSTNSSFNLSMILFPLKTESLEETVAISGMVQSMGYLIAAAGPFAAGMIFNGIHSWNLILILLILMALIQTVCGLLVDRKPKIFH
ncbi:MAG: MFS transporter [Lactobacillus sp.]|jgi:CP family cyanate transporter-like MFS transporter|nr:MFS transporter [Lactobacillus sp.]